MRWHAGLAIVVALLAWALYFVVSWTVKGATPGQRLQGLAVVDRETERPPTPLQSVLRTFGYLISFVLLGLLFLPAIFGEERRSFPDMLANTIVVSRR